MEKSIKYTNMEPVDNVPYIINARSIYAVQ